MTKGPRARAAGPTIPAGGRALECGGSAARWSAAPVSGRRRVSLGASPGPTRRGAPAWGSRPPSGNREGGGALPRSGPLPSACPRPALERAGSGATIPTFAQTRTACSATTTENLRLGSPRGHSALMRGARPSFEVTAGGDSISAHLPSPNTLSRRSVGPAVSSPLPTAALRFLLTPHPAEKQDWPRGPLPRGQWACSSPSVLKLQTQVSPLERSA